MATRIYLPSTGAAAISPTPDGAWGSTLGFDRIAGVDTKISSAFANKLSNNNGGGTAGGTDVGHLVRQYVYGPIGAQTITGTVNGQILCSESATSMDARAQCVIRVIAPDGTTVRGTLKAADTTHTASNPTSEISTAVVNRKFPWSVTSATVTSVAASNGDYIVIEVGAHQNNGLNTRFVTLRFGDNNGTDLPVDETTNVDNNSWMEFSQTIIPAGASVNSGFFGMM